MPDRPLLEVRDLHAWYGESHVLYGVDFEVRAGETVTLLGRNGAGKTTTLKSIMGMVGRRRGSVTFDGRETIGWPSNRIARLGVAADVPLVGLVAGLRVMKGHDVVVEAARILAARGARFHLALVGSGSREALVRRAVVEAGLSDRVSLTGFVRDMPQAMAALDVALYSALESEGMSRVIFEFLAPSMSHIKSGNLRALAVTTEKRFGGLPEVPSVAESGLPGYVVTSWNSLAAPAGTPRPVIDRLNQAVHKALAAPEVQERLKGLGVDARASTPEHLREFFVTEAKRWGRVVETAKIPKR